MACTSKSEPTLVGWAQLDADVFVSGPTSGQFIDPARGRTPPFIDRQPIGGFSALILVDDGVFLALPDNGYGTKQNSADFLLRVYELRPHFRTEDGGPGTIEFESRFLLRDPRRLIPFPIVADRDRYPASDITVDPAIRHERLLTGADFDVESFRLVPDGTFYFGDEFGPFLLHTDSIGVLLEPPIALPGVYAPEHPDRGAREPNIASSRGFEGMALSADGTMLYPMLEHALTGGGRQINIYAFDLETGRYQYQDPDSATYRYRIDSLAIGVPELTWWRGDTYLVIERDARQGDAAEFKKVFAVALSELDEDGILSKTELIDLLDLADPDDLGGMGPRFRYPFETIESIVVIDDSTIGIINDNNYPVGRAGRPDSMGPDHTEFLLVRLGRR